MIFYTKEGAHERQGQQAWQKTPQRRKEKSSDACCQPRTLVVASLIKVCSVSLRTPTPTGFPEGPCSNQSKRKESKINTGTYWTLQEKKLKPIQWREARTDHIWNCPSVFIIGIQYFCCWKHALLDFVWDIIIKRYWA